MSRLSHEQKPKLQNDARKIDTVPHSCCIKIEVESEIYSDDGNLQLKQEVDCSQMSVNDIPTKLPKLENIASENLPQTSYCKTESSAEDLFDDRNLQLKQEDDCSQMSVNDIPTKLPKLENIASENLPQTSYCKTESSAEDLFDGGDLHSGKEVDCVQLSENIPGVNILYNGGVTELKQNKEDENTADWSDTDAMHSQISSLNDKTQCELCDADFAQTRSLLVHMSVYHGQDLQTLPPQDSSVIEKKEFGNNDFSGGNCRPHTNADSHLCETVIYSKAKKSYKCSACDKRFSHLVILKTLQGINTEQKLYKCIQCKIDLSSKLEEHQSLHTKDKHNLSTDSKETKNNSSSSQIHQHINKGKKPYNCTECNKTFTRICMLTNHKCVHTSEKPYKCTDSGKAISKLGDLKHRKRIHTQKTTYKCNHCNKDFSYLNNLRVHLRIHTGYKPYKCTDCGKAFSRSDHLKYHQRHHSGEKPHKCTECGKAFKRSGTLKDHQRIHTGEMRHQSKEKSYKCNDCGKAFIFLYELKVHLRLHTGEKPYKCTYCGKAFRKSGPFIIHKRIHTGEKPFKCTHCSQAFSRTDLLKAHQSRHAVNEGKSNQCKDCSKVFLTLADLKEHQCKHKPYKCTDCCKSYETLKTLKEHRCIGKHTGVKPYKCSDCGKAFSLSSCLKSHQKHSHSK